MGPKVRFMKYTNKNRQTKRLIKVYDKRIKYIYKSKKRRRTSSKRTPSIRFIYYQDKHKYTETLAEEKDGRVVINSQCVRGRYFDSSWIYLDIFVKGLNFPTIKGD